jgi:hypothetical protein
MVALTLPQLISLDNLPGFLMFRWLVPVGITSFTIKTDYKYLSTEQL